MQSEEEGEMRLEGMDWIESVVGRIVCLIMGHHWLAIVWGDHVALYCSRCWVSTDAEFMGRQPYVTTFVDGAR